MEPDFDFRLRNSHLRGSGWYGLAALALVCITILGATSNVRGLYAALQLWGVP